MARYGCLVIGTILALIILFVIVYFWSGWLNRPVGHSIATTESPARPEPVEGPLSLRGAQPLMVSLPNHVAIPLRLNTRRQTTIATATRLPTPASSTGSQ